MTDSSGKVDVRKFNKQEIQSYGSQGEFIYDDVPPQQQSLWQQFWSWFWRAIEALLTNNVSGGFIKYLVIGILIALVVFAVIKIIGADLIFFSKKSKTVQVPYHEIEENIHEIDFQEEIDKAISTGNYRYAVRLLYLFSLKQLDRKRLIHWQPEKTNHAYISEIQNEEHRSGFSTLTRQFEYIWYGEFAIGKEGFDAVRYSFEQFNSRLS